MVLSEARKIEGLTPGPAVVQVNQSRSLWHFNISVVVVVVGGGATNIHKQY
jgi:hypothetical protein